MGALLLLSYSQRVHIVAIGEQRETLGQRCPRSFDVDLLAFGVRAL
jgi:hypothetical protein